ncbi:aminodeoxychorismate synthase component I [Marisediminicola sp. LYQ85]|uniref:aminodeoxychorismate synthase component I n=1 Tax=Marisediminicola sp. LYQ85 TaxID=3391062 RepID=UPI003983089B
MLTALRDTVHGETAARELDGWVDPEVAFLALCSEAEHAFWLDAGIDALHGSTHIGTLGPRGAALIGHPDAGVVDVVSADRSAGASSRIDGSMLDVLEVLLRAKGARTGAAASVAAASVAAASVAALERGVVGWLGYETGAAALGVPRASGPADSVMLVVDRVIGFDHENRTVRVTAGVGDDAWMLEAIARLRELVDAPAPPPPPAPRSSAPARARHSSAEYRELIDRCRAAITDGDAYQLCLTNRFDVDTTEVPIDVFRRLRRSNPTTHGALVVSGERAIASSSPETFLRASVDGRLETRPIKGTRPRGADAADDARLRAELVESDKERAENVMIVDLMRNDLGRVAVTGSVDVPELFRVEAYRTVFQLVSTVTAQLAPGLSTMDGIRSAFPAGSMTGAPKASAMRILAGLEGGARGAYAGAFGFVSARGAADLSMTIRTIVMTGGRASIGTGGGITALSDPALEYEEMLLKAAAPLAALGATLGSP